MSQQKDKLPQWKKLPPGLSITGTIFGCPDGCISKKLLSYSDILGFFEETEVRNLKLDFFVESTSKNFSVLKI